MQNAAEITVEGYKKAFWALERRNSISDNQSIMLIAHYRAPGRRITTRELAKTVGYKGFPGANRWYGELAKLVAPEVGYQRPEGYTFLSTLVDFGEAPRPPYRMTLRPNVVRALEEMGWVR